jgi:hypothetical protein
MALVIPHQSQEKIAVASGGKAANYVGASAFVTPGQQAAWQHQVAATSAVNQGNLATWQGDNAGSRSGAANLAMAGTLLGGIGTGIGQYSALKNTEKPAGDGSTFRNNAGKKQYTQYGF